MNNGGAREVERILFESATRDSDTEATDWEDVCHVFTPSSPLPNRDSVYFGRMMPGCRAPGRVG